MFSAALKSGAAAATPTDPQFNYVTMLLHGDGTNGGQNNTFLDSSTNNFTITRNGNTTQGSFSPYGSNWSNYFSNTGFYKSTGLLGTTVSTLTVEFWIFMTAAPSNDLTAGSVVSLDSEPSGPVNYFNAGVSTSQKAVLYWYDGSAKSAEGNTVIALNTWAHVAIVVNSNAISMYVNGVLQTLTGTTTLTNRAGTSGYTCIGKDGHGYTTGYVSNIRVTTTAVYTAAFTPPTAPLTAITGTVLLFAQSNRFVDNSTNAYAFTLNGAPSVQRFSPFAPSAAYSTATIGGSGYFDGSGDYLTIPDNAAWNMGSGDFTAEAWIYPLSFANEAMIMGQWSGDTGGTTLNWALMFSSGSTGYMRLITSSNGSSVLFDLSTSTFALTLNMWQHVAAVRSGSTFTLYINGVSKATTTNASALYDATNNFTIGAESNTQSQYFNGYIANARVVKGTAVYTSAFTPPTSPVAAVSGTSLLFDCTNAAIFDNAMMNDLETVGNAQISTSVVKYGTGSLYFDGSGDGLRGVPNLPQNQFGTGDFTVECWLYQTATNTYPSIVEIGNHVAAGGILFIGSNGSTITAYSASYGGFMGTATAPSLNTWNHIAWVRYNGTFKIYVNGVGNSGVSASTNLNSSSTFTIGAEQSFNASYTYTGYIDDLRITKGYARYTANFTPPTAAFPNN